MKRARRSHLAAAGPARCNVIGPKSAWALLVMLFAVSEVASQTCSPGAITLNSQTDVDAFQATYGPCSQVSSSLTISGSGIEDLGPLSGLLSVGTDLVVSGNGSLNSLSGLDNVTATGGQLRIEDNPALENLSLTSLTTVGSNLVIDHNDWLHTVDGLDNLTSAGQQLVVQNNALLTDLNGLFGVKQVGTDLVVLDNPVLTSCTGIVPLVDANDDGAAGPGPGPGGVPDVGGQVTLSGNRVGCNSIVEINTVAGLIIANQACNANDILLTSQAEVDALQVTYGPCTRIAFKLIISGNDITDLSALIGLTRIGTDLLVSSNGALSSLAGLGNITSTGTKMVIFDNPQLTGAGASSLIFVGSDLSVSTNAALTSLDGLHKVLSTGNQVQIIDNPLLADVHLLSLNTVGTDLSVYNNDSLRSLDGLEFTASTGNQLRIQNNDVLSNLDGLGGFAGVGTDLTVVNNPSLSSCAGIYRLVDGTDDGPTGPGPGSGGVPDVGAAVNISANGVGCGSIAEVLEYVFLDAFEAVDVP